MPLAPGTHLGPYEITTPLGAGGMGEVYRARDPQLGRDVAIKLVSSSLSRDADRLRRFEQEARAAAALNHPNILAVYQMGTHDGVPYLVSELLDGSMLRDQLLHGPMPVRKAVDYAIQTARGLAAAHEKGIVHRDLKPENLFLTRDGRIKILDFGLAKLSPQAYASEGGTTMVAEGTEPGVVLGTVGYMSPEQVRGHSTDNRTDLFSLGAILYELLTGKRAFHKPTSAETMAAILNEDPPSASQITPGTPPALQKVLQRCLEKTPEQRFHSASDLAFALEALSDSGSAPTGAFAQVASRKRWPWIVAVACGIVVLVAAAISFAPVSENPVIESVVQLTSDPNAKFGSIETDGMRVYFARGAPGSLKLAQVSVNGGQIAEVATQLNNPQIAGLSSDGSTLLILVTPYTQLENQMWLLPLPGGEGRRLSEVWVDDASMFPDGRLLYRANSNTYLAERDGSNPRKLESLSKLPAAPGISPVPGVSPDGKRLVFTDYDEKDQTSVIYEASSDGTGIHKLLKGKTQNLPGRICCGRWTADQGYLIFGGAQGGRNDLWTVSGKKRTFGKTPSPVRLTSGPLSYDYFVPSRDGKQIFAIGTQKRGELVRFDRRLHEFVPFLGGISVVDPVFSRDGQWVCYVSYPDRTLWRSRTDGSNRLQLTYPPVEVVFARISPDGKKVAFSDSNDATYLVSAEGGTAQKLADQAIAPDWSPDGTYLVTTDFVRDSSIRGAGYYISKLVDLRTGQVSTIPGSRDKLGPWYVSEDAVIAVAADGSKFLLFNFKTQRWSDIITSPGQFTNWETSADGKYFFYSSGGNDPKIFRMKLSDRSVEEITDLKNFAGVDNPALSVSPDDSAVLTRNVGTQEVYALSVRWP